MTLVREGKSLSFHGSSHSFARIPTTKVHLEEKEGKFSQELSSSVTLEESDQKKTCIVLYLQGKIFTSSPP